MSEDKSVFLRGLTIGVIVGLAFGIPIGLAVDNIADQKAKTQIKGDGGCYVNGTYTAPCPVVYEKDPKGPGTK